ncbi:MAG: hypothetical protein WAW96_11880 [Alphaproteobacteria bacterium]
MTALAVDGPWTEEGELARLEARAQALGFPADADEINSVIGEKLREGYDIPGFVYRYQDALRAAERRRRRRPRARPQTPGEAAHLIGRLMGEIEGTMEDYLTDTYEQMERGARPAHMIAGARMAMAIARMGEMLGALTSARSRVRVRHEYQMLAPSSPAPSESEAE